MRATREKCYLNPRKAPQKRVLFYDEGNMTSFITEVCVLGVKAGRERAFTEQD